ncbi:putative allantoin permease [Pelotomaculum schinkii]|uniref:Putative allantoin permease n=1 Tax=Pelotomaculum schinkii TaxID=78350 RepID=A0A4Y7R6U4_9FIRM|nr:cytosine permease [Pelotomaculum schinkii]TEB04449.1 putative allantoin permease [Pelotomaculum schinkii]
MEQYMRQIDDRVELTDAGMATIKESPLYNPDLAPIQVKDRTWGHFNYFSLWVGIVTCIPTLLLTGGMIPNLAWWQALLAICVGSLGMSYLMKFSGHAGAKYGITMGVLGRASWGIKGTYLAMFIRSSVAMGYAGIETFIGGSAVDGLILSIAPGWANVSGHLWICLFLFAVLTMALVWFSPPTNEMKAYKILTIIAVPGKFIALALIVIVLYMQVGSWGPLFNTPAQYNGTAWTTFFIACLVGAFGYWGESMTHFSDLSRYSKDTKVYAKGAVSGVTIGMVAFGMVGIMLASFSKALYGQTIWNPIDLIVMLQIPWLSVVALFFISLVAITTNIGANLTPSGYFFSTLVPKYINWRTGALITMLIGMALRPWSLLATFGNFLFDWLLLWMCWIAPLAGIMACDYWLLRKTKLNIVELFNPVGPFKYANGFNPCALIAWALATVLALIFKNESFVVGYIAGIVFYYVIMKYWGLAKYNQNDLIDGKPEEKRPVTAEV